jgi:hypothetical protein
MYPFVLTLHNLVRWLVLILAVVATVNAILGWFSRRDWKGADRKWGSYFSIALDIQLLLGLILYFGLSPIMRTAFSDFGAALSAPDVRYFALEHAFIMLTAVVLAHLGSALARRAGDSQAKFKRAAIFFSLATLLLLLGIPWMRPLLRLG